LSIKIISLPVFFLIEINEIKKPDNGLSYKSITSFELADGDHTYDGFVVT
jgi:hypothetical protein